MLNSKNVWRQPKIIRTTILHGGAEIAGGRVAAFPGDGNARGMLKAGRRMIPCPSGDGSTKYSSVTNVARISNQGAESIRTEPSTRLRLRGVVYFNVFLVCCMFLICDTSTFWSVNNNHLWDRAQYL